MPPGTVAMALVGDGEMASWDLYEVGIVAAIFGSPQPDLANPWYDLRICSVTPGASEQAFGFGFHFRPTHGLAALVAADTVIVPSVPHGCIDTDQEISPHLVDAIRQAHKGGARVVGLCDGAFAMAAAGILDGRPATVHWGHAEALARRHPRVLVDDSVLYIDDGDVLTSAGMAAGLDLCLHLVRRDLGAAVANQLARRMVIPPHRAGGQSQYVDLSVPASTDDSLAPTLEWASANLDRPLTVEDLARRARLSPRTFFRRLHAATGTTPLRWLLNQRLARAQSLLESTDLPVTTVSRLCGLGTAANLRRHFASQLDVTPAAYRQTFRRTERDHYLAGNRRRDVGR